MGRRCCALKAQRHEAAPRMTSVEPVVHAFGRFGRSWSGPCGAADRHGCAYWRSLCKVAPAKIAGAWDWSHGGWGAMGMGPHPDIIMPDAA